MILRRLSLSHWRAHTQLDLSFESGLNVLAGPNESGKSSLVEALDWVLFRDICGGAGRIKSEDVRCLVPATDPSARPRVEVEIEFANCSAIVSKVVCEEAGKRECRLCLKVPGRADEWFERTDAQNTLRALLAADGVGPGRGASPEGALLVSHQGEGVEFVLDGGAAMRSTLGVGDEGDLALTNRLEKVRQSLERERKRELMVELPPSALEGAKAATDAARARDEWKAALGERARFEAMSGEIEHLRDELHALRDELSRVNHACQEAVARQDALGDKMTAQYEADTLVSSAELERREAIAARDELAARVRDIERLERERSEAQTELDTLSASLASLETRIVAAREEAGRTQNEREIAEHEERLAREATARWRAVWQTWEANSYFKAQHERVAALETLAREAEDAQGELALCRDAPDERELRSLRRDYEALLSLERDARRGVQIAIEARAPVRFRFKADKGAAQSCQLGEGEREVLAAQSFGALDIPNFGLVKIKNGARGLDDLQSQLSEARASLCAQLAKWNVALDGLPGALDELQLGRDERDRALKRLEECRRRLEEEEERSGTLAAARARLEEARRERDERRDEARRFEDALGFREMRRADVRAKVAEAEAAEENAASHATRARNAFERAAHELRTLEREWNAASNRPDLLRAQLETRASQLEGLRSDGLDDATRLTRLRELQERAIKAEMKVSDAVSQRSEMGRGVDKFSVEAARREAVRLQEERSRLEQTLAARRRDLFHLCEQDPETRRDELDATIERLEPLVAQHEARLRGLAILSAAMELQRARLGRDLSGPLNQKLGPWLSKLRGKETELVFSEDGARLERVRTREGDATIELPFSEHSEGMKEQVAFALRLLLARRVVSRLPSQRGCVVLDDPFTQSDSSRRTGLSEVLREALESLQIVFVTCHPTPVLDDVPVNLIALGAWNEPQSAAELAPAKEKIATQVVREEALALF